jgi:hypothetical protein
MVKIMYFFITQMDREQCHSRTRIEYQERFQQRIPVLFFCRTGVRLRSTNCATVPMDAGIGSKEVQSRREWTKVTTREGLLSHAGTLATRGHPAKTGRGLLAEDNTMVGRALSLQACRAGWPPTAQAAAGREDGLSRTGLCGHLTNPPKHSDATGVSSGRDLLLQLEVPLRCRRSWARRCASSHPPLRRWTIIE